MHPLVKLVIQSVEHFIETGKPLPCPDPLLDNLKQNAGTFVSIRNQDSLRACVGTMTPKYKILIEEVIRNAIRVANEDPRFNSIENNLKEHKVKQFGLIVPGKGKRGVLLPDFDNIKSANQQLKVCLKKCGF